MRKFGAAVLVAAMVCMGFAVGVSVNVQASTFVETMSVGWGPTEFIPKDAAWNSIGSICLVVGQYIEGTGSNVWTYSAQTDTWAPLIMLSYSQTFYSVCWDSTNNKFWFCGDDDGGLATSSLFWYDYIGNTVDYPRGSGGSGALIGKCYGVAADSYGNVAAVGNTGDPTAGFMVYFDLVADNWFAVIASTTTSQHALTSISYDNDACLFYMVGSYVTTSTLWYSDTCPLTPLSSFYPDASPFPASAMGGFNNIAWNSYWGFALVTGYSGVYKISNPGGTPGGIAMDWLVVATADHYYDVAWDEDGYEEAAVVGADGTTGFGTYWRYYKPDTLAEPGKLILGYASPGAFNCVAVKPLASPKWVFIPFSGGGFKFNIMAKFQGTNVYLNAAFPHIFSIDFRERWTGISRLDQQVDADSDYTFVIETNYTVGGLDQFANADINITAWYDEGMTGTNSNLTSDWGAVENRTRQFSMVYDGLSTTTTYPAGFPFEFTDNDIAIWGPYGLDNRYFVYINVTFWEQTWAATPAMSPPSGDIYIKNMALNDVASWDFSIMVYDGVNVGAANTSYGEFGVKRAVSIIASGNPTGNAPPGTNNVVLTPSSQIAYSANCNYTLNVSIPNLYLNGIIGPNMVPAANMRIQNADSQAAQYTSEVYNLVYFAGPNLDLLVWGNRSNPGPGPVGPWDELNPPYNGTQACGPWKSNYQFPGGIATPVIWRADVPAGIPEGTYWAVITFTIWNP